jgi:hypothetical protein
MDKFIANNMKQEADAIERDCLELSRVLKGCFDKLKSEPRTRPFASPAIIGEWNVEYVGAPFRIHQCEKQLGLITTKTKYARPQDVTYPVDGVGFHIYVDGDGNGYPFQNISRRFSISVDLRVQHIRLIPMEPFINPYDKTEENKGR